MLPECTCPVCGSAVPELPISFLPERGMVVGPLGFVTLPTTEAMLLQRLIEIFPRMLTKQAAMDWLYSLRPNDEPEPKIIDVFICKIRKKVEPLGLRIETFWGKGYGIAPATKPRIVHEEMAA